ncbi:hypothetical protein IA57_01375 [Mangrovimonas yunxiaonensis]|uniref:DUF5683 domain-containing protein n=1 Tax=Mangrovimonas yunxiaonensis TaxID=1197477 RepID=A0A084TNN0_9FLAO|nr:DUF5683 domain-containing protein [Mangrovimonas yunxiaonensis]KFB02316.1 hypothetical protein IA57_01375 [Mangrovimonas yunxiaonensis]MBR9756479.1 hypothetical protein [Algicola sp.]GGH39610.1 hypothetical protein GCM10011364_09130 [Mangrovimonas yunxiaonensis]
MPSKFTITLFLLIAFSGFAFAQTDENKEDNGKLTPTEELVVETAAVDKKPIDPLAPARAAFYSAVLPGLGQAYNKKYWKIPIVYAGLGIGMYFYIDNHNEYKRYRDAYKRRLAGFQDDEFYNVVTDDGLREAQKTLRRNKEISLLVTLGIYALNIIDANVDAHLLQYNVDDNLSLRPHYKLNEFDNTGDLGLTLNFKF